MFYHFDLIVFTNLTPLACVTAVSEVTYRRLM